VQAKLTIFDSESIFVPTSILVVFSWLDRTVNEADETFTSGVASGIVLFVDLSTGTDSTGRDDPEDGTLEPGVQLFDFSVSFDFSLHSFMA
jgi:hypothetical protein